MRLNAKSIAAIVVISALTNVALAKFGGAVVAKAS